MLNPNYSVVLIAPETEPFLQLSATIDPLIYEKELIYEGAFVKRKTPGSNEEDILFGVDKDVIEHWKNTHDKMLSNGVEIPMPIEHTVDPTKNRAFLIKTMIKPNKKGLLALYGQTKFVNAEAAELAKKSDVSIFVPNEASDGKGNTYKFPIRHVAFTNYPVIPGLEKFQAIAASFVPNFVTPPRVGLQLSSVLVPLAIQMGIQYSENMDDTQLVQAIVGSYNKMKADMADIQQRLATGGMNLSNPIIAQMPPAMIASFTRLMRENRNSKLDALVLSGNITKAARDALGQQYCNDQALSLSLSIDGNDAAFDNLLAALKHNKAVNYDPITGAQIPDAIALSDPSKDMQNPANNVLLADADRRQKEYATSGFNGRS